jgi:hypothetical protein
MVRTTLSTATVLIFALVPLHANRAKVDGVSTWPLTAALATPGTYAFKLVYKVPVAMDDTTLVGALYAQSEATNLTYKISTAALSDVGSFTGTAPTITGTVFLEEEIFEVPYDPSIQIRLLFQT